jgi:hypothetical protein
MATTASRAMAEPQQKSSRDMMVLLGEGAATPLLPLPILLG